jgi:Tol biopolymer transport system component
VVFALPLAEIGAPLGGELSSVEAITSVGSFATGPSMIRRSPDPHLDWEQTMKRTRSWILLVALVLIAGTPLSSTAYTRPGPTVRVSVSSSGQPANKPEDWGFYGPALSGDGRYVAFVSPADNLAPGDSNKGSDVFLRDTQTGRTTLVSVGIDGKPGSGVCGDRLSWSPSISGNGRFVAFTSCSANLIVGDTYAGADVFVRDMVKGRTTLVSVSTQGVQSPFGGASGFHSISADGRYVLFSSITPLTDPTAGFATQVYVRDLIARTTTLVSASAAGKAGNGDSGSCGYRFGSAAGIGISANGQYAVFSSSATNLIGSADAGLGDILGLLGLDRHVAEHVYVRDLRSGKVVMVDVADDGTPAAAPQPEALARCLPSIDPSISGDGRYVVFGSSAQNLIPNAGHYEPTIPVATDQFVHDLRTGRTVRVDVTSSGGDARTGVQSFVGVGSSNSGVISADGRYTMFRSFPLGGLFRHDRLTGSTLPVPSSPRPGDPSVGFSGGLVDTVDGRFAVFTGRASTDSTSQVYRRDFGTALGVGGLAGGGGLTVAGASAFAGSGLVSAAEWAPDVNAAMRDRGADLIGASMVYRPQYGDLFVRNMLRRMPSVDSPTAITSAGVLYGVDLRVDGVRYQVRAQRVPGVSYDAAGGASFGLFRLDGGAWSQVSTLRGGYGTTGAEVVFALPLADIGAQLGGELSSVEAFTSVGSFATGPSMIVDRLTLASVRGGS